MKAAGSYESLIRGVSQQVPQDRAPGQHSEQVNLISDPVNGLTRRHGSRWIAERLRTSLLSAEWQNYVTDTNNWRSFDYSSGGKDYVLLYRAKGYPTYTGKLPLMFVYNKTDNLFMNIVRNAVDADLDGLELNGIQAITSVGKYLFMSANGQIIGGSSNAIWASAPNVDMTVCWVRGGAFSRTYSVTCTKLDNSRVTFTYTTPSSSYQTALSTADIPAAASDYTKQVNDRVNAYNGAVTAWIGTSTAAVQPSAIAESLRLAAVAAGLTGTTRQGSHLIFTGIKAITADDGGDGSLIRGVADEIESVDKVSVIHGVGKVVKVRSRNANEAYYLKAIAKDKSVTSGYTEVTWVEGAGVIHSITNGIFYGSASGTTMYLASSAALLNVILPGTHPTFSASTAGDDDSAPSPFFVGRQITYLGTFQNRLLVGAGGVLACSKTEDYLNFFRSTVLTLPGDDPLEMQAQGDEEDILRHSTMYDQDLVIFGDKRQYVISGKVALTPTSANMAVMASYQDVAESAPITAGGYVFYAKRGDKFSSLHQIQPGQTENSPESFPASSQIDSYLSGKVIELTSIAGSPSSVYLRTTGSRSSLYSFAYLDKPDGRKLDAWSRWDFGSDLGIVVGFSVIPDGLLVFSLRLGNGGVWSVCDKCPTDTGLSLYPYLDSQRTWDTVNAGLGSVIPASTGAWAAAFGAASTRYFTGSALSDVAALRASYPGQTDLWVGAEQQAYVEPTNPFMRDQKDKAILSGRLVISKMIVGFKKSTGFVSRLSYRDDAVLTETVFNGRILGDPSNMIGKEPVATGQYTIPIGRETRQYDLRISARRWYPFTLTALEWVGQFFNRTQRF